MSRMTGLLLRGVAVGAGLPAEGAAVLDVSGLIYMNLKVSGSTLGYVANVPVAAGRNW